MISIITSSIALACLIVISISIWRDVKAYKIPYGKQFLSPSLQILLLIWLAVALIGNLVASVNLYMNH